MLKCFTLALQSCASSEYEALLFSKTFVAMFLRVSEVVIAMNSAVSTFVIQAADVLFKYHEAFFYPQAFEDSTAWPRG